MSHTIKPHSCGTIREMVYNYRRGELSEVDAALFEDTIAACPACGRYARRLIDMLDVVDEAEPEDFLGKPVDQPFVDDMFASILSGIEQGEDPLGAQDGDEQDTVSEDFAKLDQLEASLERQHEVASEGVVRLDDYLRHGRRGDVEDGERHYEIHHSPARRFVLLAAMCVAVLGGGYLLYSTLATSDIAPHDMEAQQQLVKQARKIKHLKSFESLTPQPSTPDAIKVFANGDAKWHIEGSSPDYTLHLEQGTVLVEFLPTRKESLRVLTQETRVDVVGTVFYVSAQEDARQGDEIARVGVLTGKVRVKPSFDQEVVELEDGQQLEEDASITAIEAETFERSRSLIDLEAHRAVLARRAKTSTVATHTHTERDDAPSPIDESRKPAPPSAREKLDTPPSTTPSSAPAAKPSRREALQATAQKAMADKDYAAAAKAMEELLDTLPEGHMERATFRLELARIYMRHIGKRQNAIHHLRVFVAQHPHDVAAPSARRQLCRLLGPESSKEPACLSLTTP